MNCSQTRLLSAILAGASLFALAAPAAAQESAGAAEAEIGDIVVTARRQSESLQDVPISVDVTTGDQLQRLNLFDVKDIQQLTPGLELTNTSGRNNTTSLRGITFDPDQGTSPSVIVYLNEVPTDAQTVYTALYDIQQIEVLRGPQGSLRGAASPAGAITITTRRPDFTEINGFMQATVTEDHAHNVQGGISLPFSEQFAIRAAVLVDGNRLNQVYNVNRNEHSRSRTESARLTAGWKPNEDFTAYLTYQYLHADNRQVAQVFGPGNAPSLGFGDPSRSGPPAAVSDYIGVAEGPMRFKNLSHIVNLSMDWDVGPAVVSFVGAHQYSRLDQIRDQDSTNAVPNYVTNQTNVVPYKVDTAELRISSNNSSIWNWSVGAYYSKQTGDVRVTQKNDNFFGPFPVSFGLFLPINVDILVPVYSRTLSLNASSSVTLGKVTVGGAIRYSELKGKQRADINVSSPGFPGFPAFGIPPIPAFAIAQDGVPAALQERTNTPLTGGAYVSYKPIDTMTVYASYEHSFRKGSSGVAVPVGVSADLIRSNSEKTDSFEVGLKASLMDRRLNLTVAAFYQKFDGYLGRFGSIAYNCPDFFGSCNAFGPPINNATDVPRTNGSFDFNYNGDATIKGLEATLEGRLTDNWDASISAAYAKGRYDNALLPCNDYNGDGAPDATGTPVITGSGNISYCRSNSRLGDLPDLSLSANTEVRFPIGSVTPFVRALVSHRPSVTSERAAFDYQSRTNLNTYIGVRGEDNRWEINVFAKNVLNQKRITNISQGFGQQGTSSAPYLSGYRGVNVTNPREFGLTTSFKF